MISSYSRLLASSSGNNLSTGLPTVGKIAGKIDEIIWSSFKGEIKMIVHVTWSHSYETCSAHDAEAQKINKQAYDTASEKGVTVRSIYVNRPEHTLFMILEADTFEQIDDFFDPLIEMGTAEVTPVIVPKFAQ